MVKYFKTNGIYKECNLLRVAVAYKKGNGYIAKVNPVFEEKGYWGMDYCKEYYDYYNTMVYMLVPCLRKSKKRKEEANVIIEEKMNWLLEQYVKLVDSKGGKHIEILGEYEECMKND